MTKSRSRDERLAFRPTDFLSGGGETGARMRALDWSKTPLGPPERWPQSLKTIVRVMLDSRYAMWMLWGPELTFFCNDAYLPTVGLKRDWVLGARSDKVWEEIWPDIGPRIQLVLDEGQATWDEGLLLFLERSGFTEETYHTFSYSPVYDDSSRIAGMLCVVTEVTERVIGERRLRVLRDLAVWRGAQTATEVSERLIDVLGNDPLDIAFAALYVVDQSSANLRLVRTCGNLPESLRPARIGLANGTQPWPFDAAILSGTPQLVDLSKAREPIMSPAWSEPVARALVLPVQGQGSSTTVAVLVAGMSPRRILDDDYRGFFDLIVRQFAAAIADAQAYEAERRRADALAELDRAKTVFVSNVSHEFRTPLTLILGPLEQALQRDGDVLSSRTREDLAVAHRNGLRLLKLVNMLLDFSRIEAGRLQANYQPTDLGARTAELASTFRSACEHAGLTLTVDCGPITRTVDVDDDMWEKIVLNLLSNAFKFTLAGAIHVKLHESGDCVELSVHDTGTGIPAEAIPHLFERFYRVPEARGRSQEGSGIGLSFVQELVRLHGGTVRVESTATVGSTFTVRIPMHHAPATNAGPPASRAAAATSGGARPFVEEALRWLAPEVATTAALRALDLPRTPPGGSAFADRPTVILADDNADMRDYIFRLLAAQYDVHVSTDGQAALDAAHAQPPDLVLTDIMMPRLDGMGLLRALRADAATAEVPVILLSARAGEDERVAGLQAGADDYLVKPFFARELLARVEAHVKLGRLRRRALEQERALHAVTRSAQAALAESEERFRVIADSSPLVMWVMDQTAKVQFANRAYYAFVGDSGDAAEALQWHTRLHPEDAELCFAEITAALRERRPFSVRARTRRADGAWRWLQSYGAPRFASDGAYLGAVGSSPDVTDIIDAQDALQEMDRRKDEFLATLAHELRNPLAPICAAARVLEGQGIGEAEIGMCRDIIKRQAQHMTWLLDDLLDVSRVTQGKLRLRKQLVPLAHVVESALETARPLLAERRHQLLLRLPDAPVLIDGDAVRLAQVVTNLLTNAAKYTDAGGTITLSVVSHERLIEISVKDTGVGLAPGDRERIFEMFSQVDGALERAQGGLGIGLALVRGLVALHGGQVEARSKGLGHGSEFVVQLPLPRRIWSAAPADARTGPGDAVSRRILVVDDNHDAADSLAMVLRLAGHDVDAAYSGREALSRCASFRPDVVLLDIGMPGLTGYEVAQRLRREAWGQTAVLIALTGWGQDHDKQHAQAAGFDHHLTKPVNPERLEELLARPHGVPLAAGESSRRLREN